jgi:hypothetical protein
MADPGSSHDVKAEWRQINSKETSALNVVVLYCDIQRMLREAKEGRTKSEKISEIISKGGALIPNPEKQLF